MRKRISNDEKSRILEDWKKSGKAMRSYAKENGIIPQTFIRWVKLEGEGKQKFVEVSIRDKQHGLTQQEIILEKGDLKIHVPISVWKEYPETILEGLKVIS